MQHDIIVNTAAQHGRDWWDILGLTVNAITLGFLIRYTHHAKHQRQAAEKANMLTCESVEQSKQQSRDTLALAMTTLEHGHRAWLTVSLKEDSLKVTSGTKLLEFTINNAGGVPAIDVKSGSVYCVKARVSPKNLDTSSVRLTEEAYIGGGESAPHFVRIELSGDDVTVIRDETKTLWVYLEIKYSDCYLKPRATTFCWRYFAGFDRWISEPDFCRII
jgi:hypothetical protein